MWSELVVSLGRPAALAAGCTVALHACLAAGNILYALRGSKDAPPPPVPPSPDARVASAASGGVTTLGQRARALVLNMYTECRVSAADLSPAVVFEDPVMQLSGPAAVVEVFRALRALHPSTRALRVRPATAAGPVVELDLWMQYTVGSSHVRLYSLITVEFDDQGRVARLRDCWNARPLASLPPLVWARRLNGSLSNALTPRLLS